MRVGESENVQYVNMFDTIGHNSWSEAGEDNTFRIELTTSHIGKDGLLRLNMAQHALPQENSSQVSSSFWALAV